MQVSANVTERHVFSGAGHFKFFGTLVVDGEDRGTFECEQTLDGIGAAFWVRFEGGETIVRPAMRDGIIAACEAFSARVAADA